MLANEMAAMFLCDDPTPEGACGKCRCCIFTANGTNPDYIKVEPEKNASGIPVDTIRSAIVADYEIAPQFSRNKVYQINGNCLGVEAQNALLKSIEEPPENVIFIIETVNTDTLLPTIVSRAAEYKTVPLDDEDIKKFIRSVYPDIDDNELMLLADFADGIPGRAVKLREDEDFTGLKESVLELVLGMRGRTLTDTIKAGDEIFLNYKNRYMEPTVLLLWVLSDIMRLVVDIDCDRIRFSTDRARLEKYVAGNRSITTQKTGRAIEAVYSFVRDMKVNVNYEAIETAMIIKIYKELNQ